MTRLVARAVIVYILVRSHHGGKISTVVASSRSQWRQSVSTRCRWLTAERRDAKPAGYSEFYGVFDADMMPEANSACIVREVSCLTNRGPSRTCERRY